MEGDMEGDIEEVSEALQKYAVLNFHDASQHTFGSSAAESTKLNPIPSAPEIGLTEAVTVSGQQRQGAAMQQRFGFGNHHDDLARAARSSESAPTINGCDIVRSEYLVSSSNPQTSKDDENPDNFDLTNLIKMLEEHSEHSSQCLKQDVVFLLGNTGAGKSLTINYLCGRTVSTCKTQVGGDYQDRIEVEDPLEGCTVGHSADSQTRYLRAFRDPHSGLMFCDTPGFEDTEGSTVNIANAVAIASTIRSCRSVRLILLIEATAVNNTKGQELKNLLVLVQRFINDLGKNVWSVLPLFTHCEGVTTKKLQICLERFLLAAHFNDSKPFLSYMIELLKQHGEHLMLFPADSRGQELLPHVKKLVSNVIPITEIRSVFNSPLSQTSTVSLALACKTLAAKMESSFRHGKAVQSQKDDIDNLKLLSDGLDIAEVTENYKKICVVLTEHIVGSCKKAREAFEANQYTDVCHYMDLVQGFDSLREHYNLIYPELKEREYCTLLTEINQCVCRYVLEIREQSTTLEVVRDHLDRLKAISHTLKRLLEERHRDSYKIAVQVVGNRFAGAAKSAEALIESKSFGSKELGLWLDQIQLLSTFSEHLEDQRYYEGCFQAIQINLNISHSTLIQTLGNQLDEKISETLHLHLKWLCSSSALSEFHAPRAKEQISECLQQLEQQCNELFASLDLALAQQKYDAVASSLRQLKFLDIRQNDISFRDRYLGKLGDIKMRLENEVVSIRAKLDCGTFREQDYANTICSMHKFCQAISCVTPFFDGAAMSLFQDEYRSWTESVALQQKQVINHAKKSLGVNSDDMEDPKLLVQSMTNIEFILKTQLNFATNTEIELKDFVGLLVDVMRAKCETCIVSAKAARAESLDEFYVQIELLKAYLCEFKHLVEQGESLDLLFQLLVDGTQSNGNRLCDTPVKSLSANLSPSEAATTKRAFLFGFRGQSLLDSVKSVLNFDKGRSPVSDLEPSAEHQVSQISSAGATDISLSSQLEVDGPQLLAAASARSFGTLVSLVCALESALTMITSIIDERASEMHDSTSICIEKREFLEVHASLSTLKGLCRAEFLLSVSIKGRYTSATQIVKVALSSLSDKFDSMLRLDQMDGAHQALNTVQSMLMLKDFVESVDEVYRRMNKVFQEKTSAFNATVNEVLECKNFQRLARIVSGHMELEHTIPSARLECDQAQQQLTEFFKGRFEGAFSILQTIVATKKLTESKLNELAEMLKDFSDSKALFDAFGTDSHFHGWLDKLQKTLKIKLISVEQHGEICIRNLDIKGFDASVNYLESFQIISAVAEDVSGNIETLNREMLARLDNLESDLTKAIESLEYRSIDKIFNGLRRAGDVNAVVGRRLDQEIEGLEQILEHRLNDICLEIQRSLGEYDIKDAHRNLERFRSLLVSETVKGTAYNIVLFSKFQTEMDEIKQEILTPRLVTENAERINKCLEGFKEVDPRFYKRQRDSFLDKLKKEVQTCGEEVAKRDVRNLKGLDLRLRELTNYEKALRGQGCDAEIQGYKQELFDSLTDTISQVVDDIDYGLVKKKWDEVEELQRFLSKSLPILQRCDFTNEEVKSGFIAKFENTSKRIEEFGRHITSKWALIESFDLCKPSSIDAANLEMLLGELGEEEQFLDGKLGRNFASHDLSKGKAIREVKARIRFGIREVERLWGEQNFKGIQEILVRLKALSKIECLADDSKDVLNDLEISLKNRLDVLMQSAMQAFQEALISGSGDRTASRKHFQRANTLLEEVQKLHIHFGTNKSICPDDRENVVVCLMMKSTDEMAEKFKALFLSSGGPQMQDVTMAVLDLWVIPSEVSNHKVKAHARTKISEILQQCRENGKKRKVDFNFSELASKLSATDAKGGEIVEDFNEIFKAFHIAKFRDATARMTFDDSLEKLVSINGLDEKRKELLMLNFAKFDSRFQALRGAYHRAEDVVRSVSRGETLTHSKEDIPSVLAAIFAVWSISISTGSEEVWPKPHAVQVLTLFRLLGVDAADGPDSKNFLHAIWSKVGDYFKPRSSDTKSGLGHLIELKTGEGKSIVLGALATILALFGFRVDCVCYSKYLSNRDFRAFRCIFEAFGVQDKICYDTFTSLSKKLINSFCDVRQGTSKFLNADLTLSARPEAAGKKILLIDEVDVFFSQEFYGAVYAASTVINNDDIEDMQRCIWKNRSLTIGDIQKEVNKLVSYSNLTKKYADCQSLIDRHVAEMLKDVKQFDSPEHRYKVDKDGKIAYTTQDTISSNIVFGYKTLFAYFKEHELGAVTLESLKAAMGLQVKCGNFSYAEIPRCYDQILGVTGTLESLGSFEKKVIEMEYQIKGRTFTPSIYGDSKLTFREVSDVHVEADTAQYNRKIKDEILTATKEGRAVLVFFQNEGKLKQWMDSGYAEGIDHLSHVTSNTENIDHYVKQATRAGSVTLFTAVHGRGLDFVCHDKSIDAAGGMHVIQVFLSEDFSEEIQIKGRTARQDKKGTYKLILLAADLVPFNISDAELEDARKSSKIYDLVHEKRNSWFTKESERRQELTVCAKECHERSVAFQKMLLEYFRSPIARPTVPSKKILDHILAFNDFRTGGSGKCRLMCLSDATGSMDALWAGAKRHIQTMLDRIEELAGAGRVELKWVAYRDYDVAGVIECSEWTDAAGKLKVFLDRVRCHGGGDFEEAVEMALAEANRDEVVPTRVLLIGDAPPHPEKAGQKLSGHSHILTTDWARECSALAVKGIPVYTFRVGANASTQAVFKQIAEATGGQARDFVSADDLLDVVCLQALDQLGGAEMVDKYKAKYMAFSFAE